MPSISLRIPPFLLIPPALYAEHDTHGMEHVVAELGSAVPVSPLQFLHNPNLLTGGLM